MAEKIERLLQEAKSIAAELDELLARLKNADDDLRTKLK